MKADLPVGLGQQQFRDMRCTPACKQDAKTAEGVST